jgi:hypothetical protein
MRRPVLSRLRLLWLLLRLLLRLLRLLLWLLLRQQRTVQQGPGSKVDAYGRPIY